MARRKKAAAPENHERWLVSYADFITLLFAFFVLMFANSQTDKGKAAQVAESVKKAMEPGKMTALVTAMFGGSAADSGKGNAMMKGPGGAHKVVMEPKRERNIVELMPSMKVLSAALKKDIDTGKINISMEPRGLAISFKEATLFASGDDSVAPAKGAAPTTSWTASRSGCGSTSCWPGVRGMGINLVARLESPCRDSDASRSGASSRPSCALVFVLLASEDSSDMAGATVAVTGGKPLI